MRGATSNLRLPPKLCADFNPRSPCGERPTIDTTVTDGSIFQSTLPMRGATSRCRIKANDGAISIHAPHAGSDPTVEFSEEYFRFQSTLPMRGATQGAAQEGRDNPDFNPRSPCGERLLLPSNPILTSYFNPRSPCGERPGTVNASAGTVVISIHAPHAGSDVKLSKPMLARLNFNPRSPCGERQKTPYSS